jgi:hypothetical protein
VLLREAPEMRFPGTSQPGDHFGVSDSNSPAHWDGNTLFLFNSDGYAWWSCGDDLFHLGGGSVPVVFDNVLEGGQWIESTWKAADGTLYGWYHNEVGVFMDREWPLRAPRIGAARSYDNGITWEDLGIVLEAPPGSLREDTANFYFAGGNGDFCVIPDEQHEYLYFYFSSYYRDVDEQGVAVARMRYADRDQPVGQVWKWHQGRWDEPGIGGHVTPVLPVGSDWHGFDVDALWGPAIHWNTHLKQYVMLLNHAVSSWWSQEGIYVAFNPDLADPRGWSTPARIEYDDEALHGWYPQVMGLSAEDHETDKRAGQLARLFVQGFSRWELLFLAPGEEE